MEPSVATKSSVFFDDFFSAKHQTAMMWKDATCFPEIHAKEMATFLKRFIYTPPENEDGTPKKWRFGLDDCTSQEPPEVG